MGLRKLMYSLIAILIVLLTYLFYDCYMSDRSLVTDGVSELLNKSQLASDQNYAGFSYETTLTPREKRWLKRNKDKLTIGPDINFKPIEYVDDNGTYQGLAAEYIKIIEKRLGVKFELKTYPTWQDNIDAAKKREFDIWPAVAKTHERSKYMLFTEPYILLNTVLVVSDVYLRNLTLDKIKDESVVVVDGYYTHYYLNSNYPNINTVPVASTLDALRRVAFKENDAALCDIATAVDLIESSGLNNLKIASVADVQYELAIAVRDDYPLLKSIIDKTLESINAQDRDLISEKWLCFDELGRNSKSFLRRLVIILCVVVAVLLIFVIWNILLRKMVKDRTIELEYSKNRLNVFKVMADNAIYGLLYAELDGTIIYSNDSFANMHGRSVSEILGKNVDIFHNKEQMKDIEEIVKEVNLHGELLNKEVWHAKNDGTVFPTLMNFKIFKVAGHTYVSAAAIDISSSKKTQQMLVQNEKMMSLGGLAAGMAHEINNPLGAILQTLQNVQRRVDPSMKKNVEAAKECDVDLEKVVAYLNKRDIIRFITEVRKAGERAANLVSTMLQFAGDKSNQKEKEDIGALVDKALELAAHNYDISFNFDFKNIDIKKEYFHNDCFAEVIDIEIEQVIFNILKNSAQAFELSDDIDKKPSIAIKLSKEDAGVSITITDNGPGMPPGLHQKVFEPFYTSKAPGVGTGLGLSIAYFIIVDNHNGKIDIDPDYEEGTRVRIWLPSYS